jgi:hypothetical protein
VSLLGKKEKLMKRLNMRTLKETMEMPVNISDLPLFEVEKWVISRSGFTVTVKELMDRIDKLVKLEEQAKTAREALIGALNNALATR